MNTLTIKLSDLIGNYTASMKDWILDHSPEERKSLDSIEEFTRTLEQLFSGRTPNVVRTLRTEFSAGMTMFYLGKDFSELERWHDAEEDFCIQVTEDGETLCLLCKNEVSW